MDLFKISLTGWKAMAAIVLYISVIIFIASWVVSIIYNGSISETVNSWSLNEAIFYGFLMINITLLIKVNK